ncbi:MAG: hypothetical protein ACRDJH_17045 [Thermomicrobiales bacterium]
MIDVSRHGGLRPVAGFPFSVLASAGLEEQAGMMAARCDRAHRFLSDTLGFAPPFVLLVLSPGDWGGRASHPLYGMPNYAHGNLVIAGELNSFWHGFAGLIREARPDQMPTLQAVYGTADGAIDLSPFFDLLTVHELAHQFHDQTPYRFPRRWMEEIFVNLCLHAYVAEVEPDCLQVLETFPRVLAGIAPDRFPHHTLGAFEALYAGVGPMAYGWYQSRFHVAAKQVYDAGGTSALRRLWDEFVLNDDRLAVQIATVQSEIADVLTGWDAE